MCDGSITRAKTELIEADSLNQAKRSLAFNPAE
jgi:hypothetical protein